MPENLYIALISTLGSILAALIGYLGLVKARAIKEKKGVVKNERSMLDGLKKLGKVYDIMGEIASDTAAERVLIIAGHNQGGLPRPHCDFWASVIHSICIRPNALNPSKSYQNIAVDQEYVSMLLEIEDKGFVKLVTAEMPECLLREYYEMEGVAESIICYLGIKENRFFFLSAALYEGLFDSRQITAIKIKASLIKNIMFES